MPQCAGVPAPHELGVGFGEALQQRLELAHLLQVGGVRLQSLFDRQGGFLDARRQRLDLRRELLAQRLQLACQVAEQFDGAGAGAAGLMLVTIRGMG